MPARDRGGERHDLGSPAGPDLREHLGMLRGRVKACTDLDDLQRAEWLAALDLLESDRPTVRVQGAKMLGVLRKSAPDSIVKGAPTDGSKPSGPAPEETPLQAARRLQLERLRDFQGKREPEPPTPEEPELDDEPDDPFAESA